MDRDGASGDDSESLGDHLVGAVSILILGLGLLALFAGVDQFYLVWIIGYAVVLPLVAILKDAFEDHRRGRDASGGRESRESRGSSETNDALETLRDRYARGELTDEQFERKLDRLLETETLEAAEDRARERERERE